MDKQHLPSSTSSNANNKERRPYISSESLFRNKLAYNIDVPPCVPSYRMIECKVAQSKLCSYTPTLFDLISQYQTVGSSEIGPLPDLIDADQVYQKSAQRLCSEDAALIAGLVSQTCQEKTAPKGKKTLVPPGQSLDPGSERRATSLLSTTPHPPPNAIQSSIPTTPSRSVYFNSLQKNRFIHPVNASLRPTHVIPVLPHPQFESLMYVNVGFQNINIPKGSMQTRPFFVLEQDNKQKNKDGALAYSLYIQMHGGSNTEPGSDLSYYGSCLTRTLTVDADFGFALEIPQQSRTTERSGNVHKNFEALLESVDVQCVHIIPLYKNRALFSKCSI